MWFLWDFDQRQIFSVYSLRMWPLHVMDTYTLYRDSYLYLCTFRILLCIEFMWNNIVFGLVCFNTWPSTSCTTCTACKWYILCSYCNILCGSNPCGLYSEKYRLFLSRVLLIWVWERFTVSCSIDKWCADIAAVRLNFKHE